MKIRELVCKYFGHKFADVDILVTRIKFNAVNAEYFKSVIIKCQRCKKNIVLRNIKWDLE